MSHVTYMSCLYEWVMSHTWVAYMNETCHIYELPIWMSHVTHMSCLYEWVMSHTWVTWLAYTNESCHTHDWLISSCLYECLFYKALLQKRHIILRSLLIVATHMRICMCTNESNHIHEWLMSSCQHEWVKSYTWMSHVTHINASCHTYECVMRLYARFFRSVRSRGEHILPSRITSSRLEFRSPCSSVLLSNKQFSCYRHSLVWHIR